MGPQTGQNQTRNGRDLAHKPARTDSERFRTVLGVSTTIHNLNCEIESRNPYTYPWSLALSGPWPQQPDKGDKDKFLASRGPETYPFPLCLAAGAGARGGPETRNKDKDPGSAGHTGNKMLGPLLQLFRPNGVNHDDQCVCRPYLGSFPMFDPEVVQKADGSDRLYRRRCRARGVHELSRPPACPA